MPFWQVIGSNLSEFGFAGAALARAEALVRAHLERSAQSERFLRKDALFRPQQKARLGSGKLVKTAPKKPKLTHEQRVHIRHVAYGRKGGRIRAQVLRGNREFYDHVARRLREHAIRRRVDAFIEEAPRAAERLGYAGVYRVVSAYSTRRTFKEFRRWVQLHFAGAPPATRARGWLVSMDRKFARFQDKLSQIPG